jgi:hypothetical protein
MTKPDNSVRMHIAASNPAFPALRDAAITAIVTALDTVAARHGFTKKPRSWARSGPLGLASLHLHRSPYGFEADIALGFQPVSGAHQPPWDEDGQIALRHFCPDDTTGTLVYLDVQDNPASLDAALDLLDRAALPWLCAQLGNADPAPTAKAAI